MILSHGYSPQPRDSSKIFNLPQAKYPIFNLLLVPFHFTEDNITVLFQFTAMKLLSHFNLPRRNYCLISNYCLFSIYPLKLLSHFNLPVMDLLSHFNLPVGITVPFPAAHAGCAAICVGICAICYKTSVKNSH